MSTISKLIDRLNEHASILQEFDGCEPDGLIMTDYREAADTIQLLSEKLHNSQMERSSMYYNGGWIPCENRLPEKEEKCYWVCLDGGGQCQCRWTNNMYGFGANELSEWGWHIMDKPQYSRVIAWMPLPKSYQPK